MKNILILVKTFYPHQSASGNLLKKLTDELEKENNVIVLTRKNEEDAKDVETINYTKIYRVETKNENVSNSIIKRVVKYAFKQISTRIYSKQDVKKIQDKILEIKKNEKIDVIMPTTIEEIIACLNIKDNLEIILTPYLLEELPMYQSINLFFISNFIKKVKLNKLKEKLYDKSNKIFVISTLEKYFKDEKNKIVMTEHPMVTNETQEQNAVIKEIKITYAGGLDLRIRNPQKILNIIEQLHLKLNLKNVKIYFYAYGNCQKMLQKFTNNYRGLFYFKGKVQPDIAHAALKDSNIIITIGNNNSRLVPSKLFDCISTGKPILHFYYNENDKYIEYLQKYRLAKCINLNKDISKCADEVYEFIIDNCNKNANFDEIEKEYKECTPQFVCNIIEQTIDKL